MRSAYYAMQVLLVLGCFKLADSALACATLVAPSQPAREGWLLRAVFKLHPPGVLQYVQMFLVFVE